MTVRRTTWLAWSLLACALAMLVAGLALAVMNGFEQPSEAWGTEASPALLIPLAGVAFALVGAPIAARQPRNAVGWICLVCGLGVGLMALAPQYAL